LEAHATGKNKYEVQQVVLQAKFKNSSTSGLTGNDILFAFAQQGNLPLFKFESHVRQIHSVLPTLLTPVTAELRIRAGQQLE